MSSLNGINITQPARSRNQHQNLIHQYINNDNIIKNEGYIDSIKDISNIRILSLNVKGLDPWKYEKMERFLESCEKYQIDAMLLNEVNVKWTSSNLDKMEQQIKRLGRESMISAADSTRWSNASNNYLPGGVLSVFKGKIRALVNENDIEKSKLGNWISAPMQHNGKKRS